MACELPFLVEKSSITNLEKTGVYRIKNIINGKCYIGSASRIGKYNYEKGFHYRFLKHYRELEKKTHHNLKLQRAWNKYGKENFEFSILATCPPEYCIKLEQWYLNNIENKYNFQKIAGSTYLGVKFPKKHRKNISKGLLKSRKEKPEVYEALYKKLRGKKRSFESRLNISKGKLGTHKSEEGRIANRDKRRLAKSITKLSIEDVKNIRKLIITTKIPLKEIAKMYNVSPSCIGDIRFYRTFKDIINE